MYVCAARFLMANMGLWVTWKRGPDCWLKIGPTVMYLITFTNYIMIPLAGVAFFGYHYEQVKDSVYSIYTNCIVIIQLLQILFYLFVIRPYVYKNATAYLARRKHANERKE